MRSAEEEWTPPLSLPPLPTPTSCYSFDGCCFCCSCFCGGTAAIQFGGGGAASEPIGPLLLLLLWCCWVGCCCRHRGCGSGHRSHSLGGKRPRGKSRAPQSKEYRVTQRIFDTDAAADACHSCDGLSAATQLLLCFSIRQLMEFVTEFYA